MDQKIPSTSSIFNYKCSSGHAKVEHVIQFTKDASLWIQKSDNLFAPKNSKFY